MKSNHQRFIERAERLYQSQRKEKEMKEEPIFVYTSEQAVEDGIKIKLGDRLYATTNLAVRLAPPTVLDIRLDIPFHPDTLRAKVTRILNLYNAGIYADPPTADEAGEADASLALYEVPDEITGTTERVWAIQDGEGLHLILPEDY
jgi:hypothetical protein